MVIIILYSKKSTASLCSSTSITLNKCMAKGGIDTLGLRKIKWRHKRSTANKNLRFEVPMAMCT
jgi:hypothetical protein